MYPLGTKLARSRTGLPRLNFARATAINNRLKRTKVIETLFVSQTWVAPNGVNLLVSLTGRGEAGTPGTPGEEGYYDPDTVNYYIDKYKQQYTWNGTSYVADGAPSLYTRSGPYATDGTTLPADYCDAATGAYYFCYAYVRSSTTTPGAYHPGTPGIPATTGANATGFGYTFAGGVGGPVVSTTYDNVPIVPNAPHGLTIPAGGFLEITYYK